MNHQDTKAPRKPVDAEVDAAATQVVDAAFAVHSNLGPGLLESVYETCLAYELKKRHLQTEHQVTVPNKLQRAAYRGRYQKDCVMSASCLGVLVADLVSQDRGEGE